MYNLLISIALAAITFTGVALGLGPLAAIIPALIVFFAANFFLAKRIGKQFQIIVTAAQREIQSQRIDKGIKLLEQGFQFEKWQFMIAAELHANIGILEYVQKQPERARPHLEKSSKRGASGSRARAMLGCIHFQAKNDRAMREAFEVAVKAGKKEGLIWSVYAYCLDKLDKRNDALAVLGRAVQANPSDERLKANQVALQNEKRIKMRGYGPEWYSSTSSVRPSTWAGGRVDGALSISAARQRR